MADKMVKNSIYERTADIKISVKKSEIEYCFKADNVEEFEKRFDTLKDLIRQRLTNEITKQGIKSLHEYIFNQNRGETK